MTAALGFAKVNVSLRVSSLRADGFHPIESLVASVDWSDRLDARPSVADSLLVEGPFAEGVPVDRTNLVWKAVDAHREETGSSDSVAVTLTKQIPAAAGIGGGSADAAACLRLMDAMTGTEVADRLAPGIGADVPFSVVGGWAVISGYGEQIEPIDVPADFVIALVVPPIHLSTPDVYRAWDQLGEPSGSPMNGRSVPHALRDRTPLVNDLYPAAVHLAPQLGEWRHELETAWRRGVMMSGSGSSLFSFFATMEAASEAIEPFRRDARAVRVVSPLANGARVDQG